MARCERAARRARSMICSAAEQAVEQGRTRGVPLEEACRLAAQCLGMEDECRPLWEEPEAFGPGSVGLVRWSRSLNACLAWCLLRLLGLPETPRTVSRALRVAQNPEGEALTLWWMCRESEEKTLGPPDKAEGGGS